MQFGWNFLFLRFYQEIKKLIWYFNYNIIMILICQTWMKFCKQFIYFIFSHTHTHTHIYYVDFLGECLFFIWVCLDRIYSSPPPTQNSRLRHCLLCIIIFGKLISIILYFIEKRKEMQIVKLNITNNTNVFLEWID